MTYNMARRGFVLAAAACLLTSPLRAQEAISTDARDAVTAMGKTLDNGAFSFKMQTIRQYQKDNQPLHIGHEGVVSVRRPDRLRIDIDGDDGRAQIGYDGSTLTIYNPTANRYGALAVSGSIETMLRTATEKIGMDFPLADLMADQPGQSFLDGVITGFKVGDATIDGQTCDHFFYMQSPGIELELWTEANQASLPRRLIITYRSLPGEPQFVAEMSDWKLGLHLPEETFIIKPPADATKVGEKGP